MRFADPLWLTGLLAWIIAALYLMRGYRPTRRVPFLALWPADASPSPRPRRQLPHLSVLLLLLAMLLALLSLARPQRLHRGLLQPPLLIIDRGAASLPAGSWARLTEALTRQFVGERRLQLHFIPGGELTSTGAELGAALAARPPLPIETSVELGQTLRRVTQPALVVSNLSLLPQPGILQLRDPATPRNLAILRLAAGRGARSEVLITCRNDSGASSAEVRVEGWTAGASAPHFAHRSRLELARGESQATVTFPHPLPEALRVQIALDDDVAADNEAWLMRTSAPLRPAVAAAVPEPLARLAASYSRVRLGDGADALPLSIGSTAVSGPGITVAGGIVGTPVPLSGARRLGDAAWVDLPLPETAIVTAARPSGDGWQPVIELAERPLLMLHEGPHRQAWVGFWSPEWTSGPEFAVFYARLMDWVAAGAGSYDARPLQVRNLALKPAVPLTRIAPWPGLYYAATGRAVALNTPAPAPATESGAATPGTLSARLAELRRGVRASDWNRAGYLIAAAAAALALCVHAWTQRRRTARVAAPAPQSPPLPRA
jgi:hypothetical protein